MVHPLLMRAHTLRYVNNYEQSQSKLRTCKERPILYSLSYYVTLALHDNHRHTTMTMCSLG